MSEPMEHSERELQQLARIAYRRSSASVPDVESEWKAFQQKHIKTADAGKGKVFSMWMSALGGAAAMLVGFVLYLNFFSTDNSLVALQYDEMPRHIMLSDNGKMIDLSEKDSISFYTAEAGTSATAANNQTTQQLNNKTTKLQNDKSTKQPYKVQLQTLSTPRGMDFKLTLQDGTEVWLNAESTIEFPSSFIGNDRTVNLRGEAYFKVAHNAEKPFIVNLGDRTIHVLGTEFNVRNYKSEEARVILVKGSIQLCDEEGNENAVLNPGYEAVWLSGSDEVFVERTDIYGPTQWTEGFFYFEEHKLEVVLRDIGRWYNYGVIFKNEKHANYKIHFSALRNDNIESIISDLNALCGFKLSVEGKNIVVY